ncbi:MAG: efflux RND transporter periplasmic adaptor subunit [Deltaproteobacteria bacterium]|nr:efflux RND transporter periplasmic adaptor subunit [Deltaproteobacteria bacterium]
MDHCTAHCRRHRSCDPALHAPKAHRSGCETGNPRDCREHRKRLLAPFDGLIAEITGELFEYVTPSPVGVPTPPAVDIVDNACFYVTAPIDKVDAGDIRVGMTARITMDAFADRSFKGKVRRIADYVLDLEKQARTVDVEVVFSNQGDPIEALRAE